MFYVNKAKTRVVFAHSGNRFTTWRLTHGFTDGCLMRDSFRAPLPNDIDLAELVEVPAGKLVEHFGDLLTFGSRSALEYMATHLPRQNGNHAPQKQPQNLNDLVAK